MTYLVWKLSLFPLRWQLTVRYLSIICVPLHVYHVSLKLQIILKVYCINLDDRLDRSETWNYVEFKESRDWHGTETTVKSRQICCLAFSFNYYAPLQRSGGILLCKCWSVVRSVGRPYLVRMITRHRIDLGLSNLAQTCVSGCRWSLSILRSIGQRSRSQWLSTYWHTPNLVRMITRHRINLGLSNSARTCVSGCRWSLLIFRSICWRSRSQWPSTYWHTPNLVRMITRQRMDLDSSNLAQTCVSGCRWSLLILRSICQRSRSQWLSTCWHIDQTLSGW